MIYNLRNIVFDVVFALIFFHLTYAPWIIPIELPSSETSKDCMGWLQFHRFNVVPIYSESDPKIRVDPIRNQNDAKLRVRDYDPDVCIWAALYAAYLTVFHQYFPCSARSFCDKHQMFDGIKDFYVALKDNRETCIKWIKLYGFDTVMPKNMWDFINRRNTLEDKHIALWPALYAQFINVDKSRASITQEQFCHGMGYTDNEKKLLFVSMRTTLKTCHEWIVMAGFTTNTIKNMDKAAKQSMDYEPYMNEFVQSYSKKLRECKADHKFMNHLKNNPEYLNKKYATGDMTPRAYCNSLKLYGTEKHLYKPWHLQ